MLSRSYLICALPLAVLSIYMLVRPFQNVTGEARCDIASLSTAQRGNIQEAAVRLDGTLLKPGEVFSFNRVVGPRTVRRGFVPAPTYVDRATSMTVGGGICLVSSLLYQAALQSRLAILERRPHSRPTSSVEPGLDATVSYGLADLRLQNCTKEPILITTSASRRQVAVAIHGSLSARPARLVRVERRCRDGLAVEVLRAEATGPVRISKSVYRL